MRRFAATWPLALLLAFLAVRGEATSDLDTEAMGVALAESRAAALAVERVAPAVVTLRALGTGREGYGAGVMVDAQGLLLTALHVVDGASTVIVTLADGREYPGRVHASDPASDLALVEVQAPGRRFETASFGREQRLQLGETLLALSNPFGIGPSVSRGVLSARDRRGVVPGNVTPLLQTDAAINPGSSGGALVNLRGEVVGLITAILTRTGGHQGVAFAVPARELRRALPCLRRGEPVRRPWLGVRLRPTGVEDPGLKVMEVLPDSPASIGGLEVGDLLLEAQGRPLARNDDLRAVLEGVRVGTRLEVVLRRGDERVERQLEVGWKDAD